jgi:hypothetical protein
MFDVVEKYGNILTSDLLRRIRLEHTSKAAPVLIEDKAYYLVAIHPTTLAILRSEIARIRYYHAKWVERYNRWIERLIC